ncbi:Zinc finger BED domain-containing protein 4 [Chionoecetes opilio]|uniref:Zinc finger BED domain-containing protein 4 n=1 Tax=Chionoecetes opilio TaxID=41210 RepID=A0A8J5CR98_CHIOP|nr:Zinc finger BED domain-containing protein 4 [Chionoecetes opilio]
MSCNRCPDYQGKLTKYELSILREIIEILSLFELATDQCQGEKMPTSSLVIPCVRGLRAELQDLSATYKSKMVTTLQTSIDTRLQKYEDNEAFQLAAVLDPRWKMSWCNPAEIPIVTERLAERVKAITPMTPNQDPEGPEPPQASPPRKKCKLFRFMAPASTRISTPSQVEAYLAQPNLSEDSDPLVYWEQNRTNYPDLAILATQYLAIPASSAPVERLFSVAGKVFKPDRCSLSDKVFEELMFIRCNPKIGPK